MQKLKKPVSVLLSLVMIISLFTIVPITANAADGVPYISRWWDNDMLYEEPRTRTDCKKLTEYEQDSNHTLTTGWYVADDNVLFGRLTINGDVHIIVPDGVTMQCTKGIIVNYSQNTLNIYGQQNDTGTLVVTNSSNDDAAIGSYEDTSCGTINIFGGNVSAHPSDDAPGIGCGKNGKSGTVNIYGGKVNARGSAYGAGIGAGDSCRSSGTVYIYGGEVTATGGKRGAGIGGGNHSDGCDVVILGGTVTATGGEWGAGIGGGNKALGGTVVIGCDANVTAKGGFGGAGVGGGDGACVLPYHYVEHGLRFKMMDESKLTAIGGDEAAGIGGGNQEDSVRGYIEITGGTIEAIGGTNYGAGIGGGDQQGFYTEMSGGFNQPHGYQVNITGGFITARGGKRAAGIGGGDKGNGSLLNIIGGDITAYGGEDAAGIGGGSGGSGGSITIADNPVITAYGNTNSPGIGCGNGGNGGSFVMESGKVTAIGGDYAAGIGGSNSTTDFGNITINSDDGNVATTVKAQGGKHGAGIGGGEKTTTGTVTINGADDVTASGGLGGAGIGKGSGTTADNINVTINGGIVNATGGEGLFDKGKSISVNCAPAIGGNSFSGTINLNGGNIDATGARDKHISESNPNIVDYNYVYGTVIGSNSSSPRTGTVNIKAGAVIDTHIKRENNTYSYHYYANAINFNDTEEGSSCVQYDDALAAAADRVKACGWKADKIHIAPCLHGDYRYTKKDSEHHNAICLYCNNTVEEPHDDVLTSWTWGADNTTATAHFTCAKCGNTVSVVANVKSNWGDVFRYVATAKHNGKDYSATRIVNADDQVVDEGVLIIWKNSDGTIIWSDIVPLGTEPTCMVSPRKPGADSACYSFCGWSDDGVNYFNESLPAAQTETTYTPIYKYMEQTRPYIDVSGEYVPGKEVHYLINGKYYEVNEDSGVGVQRDSVDVSDFEFELLSNDTYRINKYTGTTDDMVELIIPKTYKGKPVTVVGDDSPDKLFPPETIPQQPFTLVLNENIKRIGTNAFWGVKVSTVTGDTSSLNEIGQSAFSWVNSTNNYAFDIKLDYPGLITLGTDAFSNTILTLRIKHATTFSDKFYSKQHEFVFTDAHDVTPNWQWEDDYTGAWLTLACSDTRCSYQETFTADVTSKSTEGKITYTATAEAMDEIYTDTREITTYVVTWLDEDGTELETDESVPYGSTPEYSGETPEKDECTFIGWSDGETTFAPTELPAVTENVTYKAVYTFDNSVGARVVGHSISLDGDIAVNFYMELSDNVLAHKDTAYMHFTIPVGNGTTEQSILVKDATKKESGGKAYYVFKCRVAAKEMTSEIQAQLIDGSEAGTEYTYSVKEYADYLINNESNNATYARAVPLVKKMLNYGAYAQIYFDKNPTNLANKDLPEEDKALGDVTITPPETSFDLPDGVTFEGATLSLKSETSLSLYFKSDTKLAFSAKGKTVDRAASGGYQIARIRDISANELSNNVALTVTAGEASGSASYSPMNYFYKVLNGSSDDENLKNALKALYVYAQEAKKYF